MKIEKFTCQVFKSEILYWKASSFPKAMSQVVSMVKHDGPSLVKKIFCVETLGSCIPKYLLKDLLRDCFLKERYYEQFKRLDTFLPQLELMIKQKNREYLIPIIQEIPKEYWEKELREIPKEYYFLVKCVAGLLLPFQIFLLDLEKWNELSKWHEKIHLVIKNEVKNFSRCFILSGDVSLYKEFSHMVSSVVFHDISPEFATLLETDQKRMRSTSPKLIKIDL